MEKEPGMCGVVSTGSGSHVWHIHTHIHTHIHSTQTHIMKSHKDLKEQCAFVLALLNRPNPHMLYCAIEL